MWNSFINAIGIGLGFDSDASGGPIPGDKFFLTEDGDYLLNEDAGKIQTETGVPDKNLLTEDATYLLTEDSLLIALQ